MMHRVAFDKLFYYLCGVNDWLLYMDLPVAVNTFVTESSPFLFKRELWLFAASLSLLAGLTACQKKTTESPPTPAIPAAAAQLGPPWLEDVTEQLGLDFVHDIGPVGTYFMPESGGSGAAIFDFDGDGRMDLLLLQN